jgi:hypothetical protein
MIPFIFVDLFVIVDLNFSILFCPEVVIFILFCSEVVIFFLFCSKVVIFIVVHKKVEALATDLCPSHAMGPLSNISLQRIRRHILFRNVSSTAALHDDKKLFPFSLFPQQLFVFCYAKSSEICNELTPLRAKGEAAPEKMHD